MKTETLIIVDDHNFLAVFRKWFWGKIKLSQVSEYYKVPRNKSALAKLSDVFKSYVFADSVGNRFDLSKKILKNADLLAMILPYETNSQHESQKECLKSLVFYSLNLTINLNSTERETSVNNGKANNNEPNELI